MTRSVPVSWIDSIAGTFDIDPVAVLVDMAAVLALSEPEEPTLDGFATNEDLAAWLVEAGRAMCVELTAVVVDEVGETDVEIVTPADVAGACYDGVNVISGPIWRAPGHARART